MEALRKMTLMPAQQLERRVPAMKNKGRIREGTDADIVVFDPGRIIDRATFPGADSAFGGRKPRARERFPRRPGRCDPGGSVRGSAGTSLPQ